MKKYSSSNWTDLGVASTTRANKNSSERPVVVQYSENGTEWSCFLCRYKTSYVEFLSMGTRNKRIADCHVSRHPLLFSAATQHILEFHSIHSLWNSAFIHNHLISYLINDMYFSGSEWEGSKIYWRCSQIYSVSGWAWDHWENCEFLCKSSIKYLIDQSVSQSIS